MKYFRGELIGNETIARGQRIINYLSTSEGDAVDFTDDENLFDALTAKTNVARVILLKGTHGVTSDSLSQKWLLSSEAAKRNLEHTTQ